MVWMMWVNGMTLARVGIKGHLSMERKYAQFQVRRGAQEPNQQTKTRKTAKRKSYENQGVTKDPYAPMPLFTHFKMVKHQYKGIFRILAFF